MTHRVAPAVGIVIIAAMFLMKHTLCLSAEPSSTEAVGAIVIVLLPVATVDSEVIRISDVGRVQCGDARLRTQIEALDLDDAPQTKTPTQITPAQVEFRLRLAGWDLRQITIRGPRSSVLSRESDRLHKPLKSNRTTLASDGRSRDVLPPCSTRLVASASETRSYEDLVLCAARQCVLEKLPWREQDVDIRLAQPLGREIRSRGTVKETIYTAEMKSPGPPVGRVQVDVSTEATDGAKTQIPVAFDVRHFDNVVTTARPVARGKPLAAEDLYMQRFDVTGLTDYCSEPMQLIGSIPQRAFPALKIIRTADIDKLPNSSSTGDRPIVIKPQDRVTITAVMGSFNVEVAGVAQQNGRIGDTIRVQNLDSKNIVEGRVTGQNEVRVAY